MGTALGKVIDMVKGGDGYVAVDKPYTLEELMLKAKKIGSVDLKHGGLSLSKHTWQCEITFRNSRNSYICAHGEGDTMVDAVLSSLTEAERLR